MQKQLERRLPFGAEPSSDGTHFRIWAPKHTRLHVVLEDERSDSVVHELTRDEDGCFSGSVAGAGAGTRYRYRTADGRLLPDPASRSQPDGPHGPSEVVDPDVFGWTDSGWGGPADVRHVIYEMHIGTYTRAGTWQSAARHLEEIAALGVTMLEIMPVAEFPGRFNWGYDGVAPFAPAHVYGTPDDMRRFVDDAHAAGLSVVLDVVYNHMGPDGCYFSDFADEYFSTQHTTDWGAALNFDGPGSSHVREYFLANAAYWIREFHLDGLRIDATQNIYDHGPRHILTELVARTRAAAPERRVWIIAENEPQDIRAVLAPDEGGHGMDLVWNDDFHHTAMVALTGSTEAYYTDYGGTPQELISCARHGFLVSGTVLLVAGQTTRHACAAGCSTLIRELHPEPRSDSELRGRQTAARVDGSGGAARDDGFAAADARDCDAVSGAGVRCHGALPLLRGPQAGRGKARAPRTP